MVVPSTVEADKALDDNERYKVVWTVLNALRATTWFNATVNKIELNRNRPENILVGRTTYTWEDGAPVEVDPDRCCWRKQGHQPAARVEIRAATACRICPHGPESG